MSLKIETFFIEFNLAVDTRAEKLSKLQDRSLKYVLANSKQLWHNQLPVKTSYQTLMESQQSSSAGTLISHSMKCLCCKSYFNQEVEHYL